jgi:hypothetical protein
MMRATLASVPGAADVPNEDRAIVLPNLIAVLDGATVRTETGCVHGVAWYVDQLLEAIVSNATLAPSGALKKAIEQVAGLHRETCDLAHPATPSAAVALVKFSDGRADYVVLGDVTVALDFGGNVLAVSDKRVDATASVERREADSYPSGSSEKKAALVRMKHAELAARNTADGYWIAAAYAGAVDHALTGSVPLSKLDRIAVLTDGATRAVEMFEFFPWSGALDFLATRGPDEFVDQVRRAERTDPTGERWPRNKPSDDATAVYCAVHEDRPQHD